MHLKRTLKAVIIYGKEPIWSLIPYSIDIVFPIKSQQLRNFEAVPFHLYSITDKKRPSNIKHNKNCRLFKKDKNYERWEFRYKNSPHEGLDYEIYRKSNRLNQIDSILNKADQYFKDEKYNQAYVWYVKYLGQHIESKYARHQVERSSKLYKNVLGIRKDSDKENVIDYNFYASLIASADNLFSK